MLVKSYSRHNWRIFASKSGTVWSLQLPCMNKQTRGDSCGVSEMKSMLQHAMTGQMKNRGGLFIQWREVLYLNRLLSAKLLQVAHHLSLIDYLSLSLHPFKPHPSMNIEKFVSLTYIGNHNQTVGFRKCYSHSSSLE